MTENYVLENYAASHIHVDEILVIYLKKSFIRIELCCSCKNVW